MSDQKTMYAVLHLEKGKGNDAGMTAHIERKTVNGRLLVPENADRSRTHLNRELITFPDGVRNRTEAIRHRLETAGIGRKVTKDQVKVIRVMLTGTHEQMMELADNGRLDEWAEANLKWLRQTFGEENVVSVVLHMDEKTPHLHATVVPIVTGPRKRRTKEGEQKYQTKDGPRLSVSDLMTKGWLRNYQDTYGTAMKPFGLERGIIGSAAKHKALNQHYKEQAESLQTNIDTLLAEVEQAKEGKNRLLAFFGKGQLADARKQIDEKDEEIEKLKAQIAQLKQEKADLARQHRQDIANLRSNYQKEIDAAIAKVEQARADADAKQNVIGQRDKTIAERDTTIKKQQAEIRQLYREAHPEKYTLTSGATLDHIFVPNMFYSQLHIWTKVGSELFDDIKYDIDYDLGQRHRRGEITDCELVNAVFEPREQVSQAQAKLLGAAFELACGGPAQAHIGTGGGGSSQSETGWDGKKRRSGYGM